MCSLIGGIFILLGAYVLTILSSVVSALSFIFFFGTAASLLNTLAIVGYLSGILVIVGGVLAFAMPNQHVIWGVIVLVFSLVSIVALGGLIIGFILGLVGGILAIVWKPPMAPMMAPPMAPMPPP